MTTTEYGTSPPASPASPASRSHASTHLCLKFNTFATNDPCALCGARTDLAGGFELFLDGTSALVCDRCGDRLAPELVQAREALRRRDGGRGFSSLVEHSLVSLARLGREGAYRLLVARVGELSGALDVVRAYVGANGGREATAFPSMRGVVEGLMTHGAADAVAATRCWNGDARIAEAAGELATALEHLTAGAAPVEVSGFVAAVPHAARDELDAIKRRFELGDVPF